MQNARILVASVEHASVPMYFYLFTFCSGIVIRSVLESYSDSSPLIWIQTIHYFFFYTSIACTLVLLFRLALNESIGSLFKIILPGFTILPIAPLLDLFLSGGIGYNMSYLGPSVHDDLFIRYFTFFGDWFGGGGITPGIKIELSIIILSSALYFFIKTGKILGSILLMALIYSILFLYAIFPFYAEKILTTFNLSTNPSGEFQIHFFLVLTILQGCIIGALHKPALVKALIKDARIERCVHYFCMYSVGQILAYRLYNNHLSAATLLAHLIAPIAIILAILYLIIINNLSDIEIDQIANPHRPLFNPSVEKSAYLFFQWPFLVISLLCATTINCTVFLTLASFVGIYYLYSMPPLRLKRVPFFSKLTISFASYMLLLMGAAVPSGKLQEIPGSLVFYIFVPFFAASNFIDLKDYEGDRAAGIRTLPVVLGLRNAKIVIGLLMVISYMSIYFIFKNSLVLAVSTIVGIVQFFLINRSHYDEKPVFGLYLISLIFMVFFLAIGPLPWRTFP